MGDDFVDAEVVDVSAAAGDKGLIMVLRLRVVIPGRGTIYTEMFRFQVPASMVGEMIDSAVTLVCERNPGLAQAWLRAVSATLVRLAAADRDARQDAVSAVEELLQRPPTSNEPGA